MRTRAAVAIEAGKPLEVMDVNLEGPKAGDVIRTNLLYLVLIRKGCFRLSWDMKELVWL